MPAFPRTRTGAALVGCAAAAAALAVAACSREQRAPTPTPDARTAALAAPPPAAPVAPEPPPARGTHIALLYSSNERGEYEQCGCPAHPLGGVARRATLVDRARAEADAALHVGAGDLLLPRPLATPMPGLLPPEPKEVERRARLLLAALARTGLDAYAPGESDLVVGPARLSAWLRAFKIPVVCANLTDAAGKRLFPADRLIEKAGLKIGIFGLIGAPVEFKKDWQAMKIAAADPLAAAREVVASLRARGADLVVGLFHLHGGVEEARALARDVKGVDFVVLGHGGANLELAEEAGDARLVEAFEMGKHLGRLDLHVVEGGTKFRDRGQRAQLQQMVQSHRTQQADYRKRMAEPATTPQIKAYYEEQIAKLETEIRTKQGLIDALPAKVAGSWFENRIFELDSAVPDHPGVALLVDAYNQENARRGARGLPVGVAHRMAGTEPPRPKTAAPAPESPASYTYAGTAACGACHQAAMAFWKTTKHAMAIATLRSRGRDKDPTCAGCHVTAFLQPGGTRDLRIALARFPDVGCEACHGPGLAHVTAENKQTSIRRKVEAATCLGCHTPDQTNNEFDYGVFLEATLGPGHGAPPPPATPPAAP